MEIDKFRYDINTLRAIAVISVVLYHYHIPGFSGGFCGVDVFFVISGYLMSSIIIGGINNGRFSYLNFYKKRVERIVPALLFLVLILTIAGSFFYFPADYKLNERNATASLLFVSNFLYWRTTNYFGPIADNNILLHTWSLSVEWQFYIIYPVILVLVNKLKGKYKYVSFLVIATLMLFILTVFLVRVSPAATFYLLPCRAWEMFFGGIAFAIQDFVKIGKSKTIVALTGYALIVGTVAFTNSSYLWPGALTFIPVFGTFLVIVANQNNFSVIKNQIIKLTGKISYSLYLWHWPVLIVFKYMGYNSNYVSALFLFSIASILAYLSYKYIERSKTFAVSKNILIMACLTVILTSALSFFNSNQILFNKQSLYFSGYVSNMYEDNKKQFSNGCCLIETRDKATLIANLTKNHCLTFDKTKKNILIIGDSHCAELSLSLKEALAKRGIHVLQATATGWLPLEQPIEVPKDTELADYIFHDFIIHNLKNIDGIILDGNWLNGFNDLDKLGDKLDNTIKYLNKYGIKTLVIGQTEAYIIPYPIVLAKEYQYHRNLQAHFVNKNAGITNQFLSKKLPSVYTDIYNTVSPSPSTANIPYMFDDNHLSKYGADLVVKKILLNPIAIAFFK